MLETHGKCSVKLPKIFQKLYAVELFNLPALNVSEGNASFCYCSNRVIFSAHLATFAKYNTIQDSLCHIRL